MRRNPKLDTAIEKYAQMCTDRMGIKEMERIIFHSISDALYDLPEEDAINQIIEEFPDDFTELTNESKP